MYARAPSTSSRVKTVEAKIENMSVATKMAPKQISRKIPSSESSSEESSSESSSEEEEEEDEDEEEEEESESSDSEEERAHRLAELQEQVLS